MLDCLTCDPTSLFDIILDQRHFLSKPNGNPAQVREIQLVHINQDI